MQRHTIIMLAIVILVLGCSLFKPQDRIENQPIQVSTQIPATIPTGVATLPPLPDFAKEIILAGYGGGGEESSCRYFDLPPSPSIIGGTTYFVEKPPEDLTFFYPGDYPRNAELCISDIPKNQPVTIKLTSPDQGNDQKVVLTTQLTVTDDPQNKDNLIIDGETYWGDVYRESIESPIELDLKLWWAGGLPSGIWQAEAIWPGRSIRGNFYVSTRTLPEISLTEPKFENAIFPSIHIAPKALTLVVMAENFPPNSLLHVLVYHCPVCQGYQSWRNLELVYATSARANDLGVANVSLSFNFSPKEKYYILGVQEGITELTKSDGVKEGVLAYSMIANALDSFMAP